MLAIADAANADGRRAAPGMERLLHYSRKKRAAVLESIRRNVERGELRRTGDGHRGSHAEFEIVLPGLPTMEIKGPESETQSAEQRVQKTTSKGPENDRKGSRFATSAPLIRTNNHERATPRRAAQISETWNPSPELVAWSRENHPRVDHRRETAKFIDHAKATGRSLKDWDAGWRNWIRKADEMRPKDEGAGARHHLAPKVDEDVCPHGLPLRARCEECEAA